MQLHFTRNCILNTKLVNDEGQEVFFVNTPWRLTRRTTTISKADKQLEVFAKFAGSLISDSKRITFSDDFHAKAQSELARIHWRCLGHSRLQFGGFERDIHEYLVRSGFLGCYRTFTAPDGRSYRWKMGTNSSQLYTNDDPRTLIAKFHRQRISIPGLCKGRRAYLENFPAGEHIADAIVITFIYVERRRQDMESAGE